MEVHYYDTLGKLILEGQDLLLAEPCEHIRLAWAREVDSRFLKKAKFEEER